MIFRHQRSLLFPTQSQKSHQICEALVSFIRGCTSFAFKLLINKLSQIQVTKTGVPYLVLEESLLIHMLRLKFWEEYTFLVLTIVDCTNMHLLSTYIKMHIKDYIKMTCKSFEMGPCGTDENILILRQSCSTTFFKL